MSSEESEKKEERKPRESSTTDLLGIKVKNSDITNFAIGGLSLATLILGVKVFAPHLIPFPAPTPPVVETKKETDSLEQIKNEILENPISDAADYVDYSIEEDEEEVEDDGLGEIKRFKPLVPPAVARLNVAEQGEKKLELSSIDDLLE
ncbi:MAG: hypothetical protein R3321_02550 [Nitrososphaeraceae archaeon]|nr:hypothetical protein [Nitrososphaeraceae archaeon]